MIDDWSELIYKDVVDKISTAKQKIKQKQYLPKGDYPIIDQGQEKIGGYTNDSSKLLECRLPVIVFGDHTKICKYVNFPFAPGADGTKVILPKEPIYPKFVFYLTQVLAHKIKDKGYARHYQHIEKEQLPVAPLPEQRAIVSKIEQLFSELDNGILNLKQAKSRLEVYKQAILKKAFEGELTKEWRNNQTALPTSDELTEKIEESRVKFYESQIQEWDKEVNEWNINGKIGKKPAKPKIAKPLENFSKGELQTFPPLPENWTWSKVDKFAAFDKNSLKAGPFGSSLKKAFYVESGYKIYGQEQVIAGNSKIGNYYVNDDKYQELINCAVKPNDILISLVGTVGKVLILPQDTKEGIINPRLVKITPNEFTNPIYFKYYFESAFLKSLYKAKNHGTTMDVLNLGIIKDLAFPLCSKHEQNEVVKEIESRLSVCDKVLSDIEENLQKTEALRQSILKKAFSGKLLTNSELVACKKAADWEPAEKLIQKIKDAKSTKKVAS